MPQEESMDTVERFVRWASDSKRQNKGMEAVCLRILKDAGFEVNKVSLGQLRGHYLEQDGSRTGETFAINSSCPFKAMNGREDNYTATGWLDSLFRLAWGLTRDEITNKEIIRKIRFEIERSIPMKPIVLTDIGDQLLEYPPDRNIMGGNLVDHTRDSKKMELCVGLHAVCQGWIDREPVTQTHDALICRSCHLRVPFPKELKTYGNLRQHLRKFNAAA